MILNQYPLQRIILITLILFLTNVEGLLACEATISLSSVSGANLAAYRIYYGTESGDYTNYSDIGTPNIINGLVTGAVTKLSAGESYFFSATAYYTDNSESPFSNEVSATCPVLNNDDNTPVVTAPVVTAPVVTAPVVTAPVVTAPVVTAPTVTNPVATNHVNEFVADELIESAEEVEMIENFVTRFYEQCLYRAPDLVGLEDWVDALFTGSFNGAELAESFIFSQEFINLNTTDDEFVTTLYKAFFDREPDSTGFNSWVDALHKGWSRKDVFDGFTSSTEFINSCDSFGIEAYEQQSVVENFVTKFYEQSLGRAPDQEGLNSWVDALVNGDYAAGDVARSFILSQEFLNLNTTNEKFMTTLYITFFSREPDSTGFNGWVDALINGWNREEVLDSFIVSSEFVDLCNYYGLPNE